MGEKEREGQRDRERRGKASRVSESRKQVENDGNELVAYSPFRFGKTREKKVLFLLQFLT